MRYSYYKKLISEERRQRAPHYGHQARMRQLTILTCTLLSLYAACAYSVWRHPRPIHHVWIDEVLVEVVEENWVDHARSALLYMGLCCGGLLALLRVCFGVPLSSSPPADSSSGLSCGADVLLWPESAGRPRERRPPPHSSTTAKDVSTIAVPSWARRRVAESTKSQPWADARRSGGGSPATGVADRTRAFDARRPMRSDKDLHVFLAYEAAQQQTQQQQQQQRRSTGDGVGLRYRGVGVAEYNVYPSDADVAGCDALSVTYEGRRPLPNEYNGTGWRGGGGSGLVTSPGMGIASTAAASTLPWAELGIYHLEEALQRTREWMSGVCRKLVDDIDQCDRWFDEHQMEAFDCHHSLQEVLPAPAPAPAPSAGGIAASMAKPGGWWGAGSSATTFGAPAATVATAPTAPQLETRLTAILRAKANSRQAQQGMQELDMALRYDQRLTLETSLDVSGTFPSSSVTRPSNAELAAQREYVIDRLRTFAKQRFLVSYNASGGDAEMWRSNFPCDAHLLLHVLRISVKGLSEYVRFGYQTGTQTQDLALYVGDTGEPYFYVRFRQGSSETLLSTRQGATSLMEAVLAFAAVIHTYYRDVFGGIRGTVDLSEVGLLKVVTESRRSAWGTDVG